MSAPEHHSSYTPSPEPPLLSATTPGDQPPPSFSDRVSKYEASSFLIRQAAPGKYTSVRETSFSENPDDDPVTTTTTMADEDTSYASSNITSPDASLVRRPRDLPPPLPPKPVDEDLMSPSSPPEDIPPPPPQADLKPILKRPTVTGKPSKILTSTSSLSKTPKPKGIWFNMGDQYPVENFSGRAALLDQLETLVTSPKSRDVRPISLAIVLAGERGMGKTEIARKFAFRFYVEANGSGNVVWLDASSKQLLRAQLSLLYEKEFLVKTPTVEFSSDEAPFSPSEVLETQPNQQAAPEKSAFKFKFSSKNRDSFKSSSSKAAGASSTSLEDEVQTLLASKTFQKFPSLFIFDEAKCEEDIIEFLPKLSPIGFIPSVIVTSRNKNWNNSRLLPVNEYEFNEAVDFFQENLGQYPEFRRYQGEDLAKDLHRFPPLLQRAKNIVAHYVPEIGSERALLKLEKNIGLVRRLKHDAPFHKMVEQALLAVDRGVFYQEDSYIREFDGELRNHPIMMTIRQLEAAIPLLTSVPNANILAVNADAYSLCLLSFLMDKFSTIDAVHARLIPTDVEIQQHPSVNLIDAHDPLLFKNGKIQILAVDMPKPKTGTVKTISLIEKYRSHEKKTYDLIMTPTLEDDDVSTIRKMLNVGGLFVTSTTSANTTVLLKKNDSKKSEMKILKQESAQLLVTIRKL